MFPGDWFTFYKHLHNGKFPRKLPSELRDVGGEKLQGVPSGSTQFAFNNMVSL